MRNAELLLQLNRIFVLSIYGLIVKEKLSEKHMRKQELWVFGKLFSTSESIAVHEDRRVTIMIGQLAFMSARP